MQTVSPEDNLHEVSKRIFEKKKNINMSSAEFAQFVLFVPNLKLITSVM